MYIHLYILIFCFIEGNYTHIGIAVIKDAQGRYYFTQLFYR